MKKILMSLLAVGVLITAQSYAEEYPAQTVRIVVPYPAGGTADTFARYLAEEMRSAWQQQNIVVENRGGAGGNIASTLVANATPDGYTLLLGTSGSNAVNPSLYKNLPYDAAKQMTVIATVATTTNVLVASADSPVGSVKELIEKARNNPGSVTYASSGIGSVLHLSSALLANRTGVSMTHIPYEGTAPAMLDVVPGRVDFMIANAPSAVGLVDGGKLKALAVTGSEHSEALPGVPTMQEAGIENYDLVSWFATMGPSAIPRPIRAKINGTVNNILKQEKTRSRFASIGATPLIKGVDEAAEFFRSELKKWAEVVEISGAKVE